MSDRISTRGANRYHFNSASSGSDNDNFIRNVDTKGSRDVEIVVWLRQFAYSATNKLKFELQDSDTTTAADYADVDADLIDGGDGETDGLLFERSSAVAANKMVVYKFNYKGSKRYLRVKTDETGTTTGAYGATVRLGSPRHQPRDNPETLDV